MITTNKQILYSKNDVVCMKVANKQNTEFIFQNTKQREGKYHPQTGRTHPTEKPREFREEREVRM